MFALVRNDVVVKFPYTLADLRRDNPGEEFPDDYDLAETDGVLPVGDAPVPKVKEGQTLDEDFPAWSNGKLVRKYLVHDWLTIEAGVNYVLLVDEVAHYPVTLADLRREKGSALSLPAGDSIQQMDGEWGMYPCETVEAPNVPANRTIERIDAEEYAPLKFRQKYVIRNRTTEELAEAKAAKRQQVNAKLADEFQAGFTPSTGPLAGKTLQTRDMEDRTNWLTSQAAYSAAVAAGQGNEEGAVFRTAANETIATTYQNGLLTLLAMAAWGKAIMGHSWSLKDEIEAAQSFADLAAIDIEAGWPS